jgi:hypothetical protein
MTAKEKAKELVDIFKGTTVLKAEILNDAAKSCALLSVDEIASALNEVANYAMVINGEWGSAIEYWQQVKIEIEDL